MKTAVIYGTMMGKCIKTCINYHIYVWQKSRTIR